MQSNSLETALPFPGKAVSIDIHPPEKAGPAVEQTWLVSPVFDYLLVCGLAPWCLGALTYLLLGNTLINPHPSGSEHNLSILYIVASLIIGESHQFTSIVRYFFGPKPAAKVHWLNRLPLRLIWLALWIIVLAILSSSISGLSWISSILGVLIGFPMMIIGAPLLTLAANCFPLVLMHHICAQAKTIGLIYCRQAGYQISRKESRDLSAATFLLVLAGACNVALPFNFDSDFTSSEGFALAKAVWNLTTVLGVAFVAWKHFQRAKAQDCLPIPTALLWTNLVLFVLLPANLMLYVWLFVPIFFHATQHWAVAWATKQKEVNAGEEAKDKLSAWKNFLPLFLPVQALTLTILFLPAFIKGSTLGSLFGSAEIGTLSVGWSMLVFYIHYFTDRIVWRPRPKEALNETKA